MSSLNESIVEDAALEWFGELSYGVGHGPQHPDLRADTFRGVQHPDFSKN